tara:strand:- start:373 stop:597 length:225 start_codon:yes stop_codon:yes gene_type:complete
MGDKNKTKRELEKKREAGKKKQKGHGTSVVGLFKQPITINTYNCYGTFTVVHPIAGIPHVFQPVQTAHFAGRSA